MNLTEIRNYFANHTDSYNAVGAMIGLFAENNIAENEQKFLFGCYVKNGLPDTIAGLQEMAELLEVDKYEFYKNARTEDLYFGQDLLKIVLFAACIENVMEAFEKTYENSYLFVDIYKYGEMYRLYRLAIYNVDIVEAIDEIIAQLIDK